MIMGMGMTSDLDSRPHVLYRFFDDLDVLLYVGITVHLPTRLADHEEGKPWWPEVARMTAEPYPDRPAVLAAEKMAIQSERPKYNVQHNGEWLGTASEPISVAVSAIGEFDHSRLAENDRYLWLRRSLNEFANLGHASMSAYLNLVRQMAITSPYADKCTFCRDHGQSISSNLHWPIATVEARHDRAGGRSGSINFEYRCERCGDTWTRWWRAR